MLLYFSMCGCVCSVHNEKRKAGPPPPSKHTHVGCESWPSGVSFSTASGYRVGDDDDWLRSVSRKNSMCKFMNRASAWVSFNVHNTGNGVFSRERERGGERCGPLEVFFFSLQHPDEPPPLTSPTLLKEKLVPRQGVTGWRFQCHVICSWIQCKHTKKLLSAGPIVVVRYKEASQGRESCFHGQKSSLRAGMWRLPERRQHFSFIFDINWYDIFATLFQL